VLQASTPADTTDTSSIVAVVTSAIAAVVTSAILVLVLLPVLLGLQLQCY